MGVEAPLSKMFSTLVLILLKAASRKVVMAGGVGCESGREEEEPVMVRLAA